MSPIVSVVIVEDNSMQRRRLEEMIASNFPLLKVVASCSTFKIAQQAIQEQQPQLWLLDVQLDGNNTSIPLLELGIPGTYEVIFITGETDYVQQNLLSQACATLVKPYTEDRFVLVVNKALQNIALKRYYVNYDTIATEFRNPEQLKDKIAFRRMDSEQGNSEGNLIDFILFKKLLWLHSAGDHKTNLHCLRDGVEVPECLTATRSLGEWEGMLKGYRCFERISRSVVINLQYAVSYNRNNNKIKLQYDSGDSVRSMDFEVSEQYKVSLTQHYNSVIKNPF